MERYWDCSLCRIENKGKAPRCRNCYGKLQGRDRLLREVSERVRVRPRAALLSGVAAGLGQIYSRRWTTGVTLAVLLPLAIGLVWATWSGFTYGHLFLVGAAVFVLALGALDAYLGPRRPVAPCQQRCPAHLDVPDYLQLLLDDQLEQAYALIRTRIPLVGVIGRICPHPCEAECVRGIDGEPIAINGVKRYLADRHREAVREGAEEGAPRMVLLDGKRAKVAVVGSGPAGLACAYYLAVMGASVTVFEADRVLGGRLTTAIPDYRLPPLVVDEEIEDLRERGVTFRTGQLIGPGGESLEDLLGEYQAVFLGVGAVEARPLGIGGDRRFLDFQEVLRAAKFGHPLDVGRRVAVIGGGNAAMDVSRVAFRLGAEEVHVLYRRSREEMPAREEEMEEAIREGVRFHFLADPDEALVEDGRLTALRVKKMRLVEPDASGRRRPVPVPGEEWVLPVDVCVPALGQRVGGELWNDPALAGLRREADGRVWADPRTQRTSVAKVYAGGDAVTGPATAVQAMAQGRRAALGIYRELSPAEVPTFRLRDRRIRKPFEGHRETPEAKIREEMPKLSVRARRGTFREVEEGLRTPSACREAGRCLQCHREL